MSFPSFPGSRRNQPEQGSSRNFRNENTTHSHFQHGKNKPECHATLPQNHGNRTSTHVPGLCRLSLLSLPLLFPALPLFHSIYRLVFIPPPYQRQSKQPDCIRPRYCVSTSYNVKTCPCGRKTGACSGAASTSRPVMNLALFTSFVQRPYRKSRKERKTTKDKSEKVETKNETKADRNGDQSRRNEKKQEKKRKRHDQNETKLS